MKILSQLFLLVAVVSLVISLILAIFDTQFIATPNGWLDLSLVCGVLAIGIAVVFKPAEKKEEPAAE